MKCFEVAEGVERGIRIGRFPEPHVMVRGTKRPQLDAKLTDFIRQIPQELKGDLVLSSANLMLLKDQEIQLAPETPEWKGTKALVRIATVTTEGTLSLTADCWVEEEREGRVERLWCSFPPPGVKVVFGNLEPLTVDHHLVREVSAPRKGLDLFVVMEAGAAFRIVRTGHLQGASPEIFVRWYGDNLITRVPGRYRKPTRATHEEVRSVAASIEGLEALGVETQRRPKRRRRA